MIVLKLQFASIQMYIPKKKVWYNLSQYVAMYKEFCAEIKANPKHYGKN